MKFTIPWGPNLDEAEAWTQERDSGHGDGGVFWTQNEDGLFMMLGTTTIHVYDGVLTRKVVEIKSYPERDIDTRGIIDFWRTP